MTRLPPEFVVADRADCFLVVDASVREETDEEEEEEDEDEDEDEDDGDEGSSDGYNGYSE